MRMKQEAARINQVFTDHGIQCRVLPPPQSYVTAAVRVYRLDRAAGVTVNKVVGLADEVDEVLTAARQRPVRCRFERLPLSLEVPRPDPKPLLLTQPLRWLHRNRPKLKLDVRLLGVLGEANSYRRADTLLLNLTHPNSPHALVAGTTGSGKTNLLASLVLSMAVLHSPHQLALVLLDPKGIDLVRFKGLPHLAYPIVDDAVVAVQVLEQVVREMQQRKREGVAGPRIVVVIDELAELADVAGDRWKPTSSGCCKSAEDWAFTSSVPPKSHWPARLALL